MKVVCTSAYSVEGSIAVSLELADQVTAALRSGKEIENAYQNNLERLV